MAGYLDMIGGDLVAWRGYRLPLTPISVCQGEYIAATIAVPEALALNDIKAFLGFYTKGPIIVFCDNQTAVSLADSNASTKRMRHISTRIAFLREQVNDGTIMMYHISTTGQLADIFTKALPPATFHKLRALLIN